MSLGIEDANLDNCRQQINNFSRGNIPEVFPGTHVCVLTTQGQLALVQIDKVSNPETGVTTEI
jgi:hypothetical protein